MRIARHRVDRQEQIHRSEQIADQAFAVAPEPVGLGEWDPPAISRPALERDTSDPASTLADRGLGFAREIFAGGDEASVEWDEDLAVAEAVQFEAGFVVLGEAGRVERPAAALAGEVFHGFPGEPRAYAVGGEESRS